MAVRHAGRQGLPPGDETHGRRRVGTGQTAATGIVSREIRAAVKLCFARQALLIIVSGCVVASRPRRSRAGDREDGRRRRLHRRAGGPRRLRSMTPRAPGVIARISAAPAAPRSRSSASRANYAGKDLKTLFTKVATTMPRGAPGSLGENVYLDIVAHLLKENGFPAGSRELTAEALDGIRVMPGQPKPPPPIGDFSYVEVVGCLTAGPSEHVAADAGERSGRSRRPCAGDAGAGRDREAARHADVSPAGRDGLRARRSQGPEDLRSRLVDQASRRAAHDDQRVRDGVADLRQLAEHR